MGTSVCSGRVVAAILVGCLILPSAPKTAWSQEATAPPVVPTPEKTASTAGQADLDEAISRRIEADSDDELAQVAALLESARTKGLDEANAAMASEVLGSVLLERAQRTMPQLMRVRGRRAMELREEVIEQLSDAVDADPTLVEAHLMKARIEAIGGDAEAARKSASKAIELLAGDPSARSEALLMRAMTQPDDDSKLTDLSAAIQSDEDNLEAYRARAAVRMKKGQTEAAINDLRAVLEAKPEDKMTAALIVENLMDLDKSDEALELLGDVIRTNPSEEMFKMRALVHQQLGNNAEAAADLNEALKLRPKDPLALLQRAELSLENEDVAAAKADLQAAMNAAPQLAGNVKALALKAQIAIVENRVSDAINTIQTLADQFPDEPFWQLRLATLYTMDSRPRQAIDVLSGVLRRDPDNVAILRSRGDALLSVGDHSSAIDDYERAIRALGNFEKISGNPALKEEASGLFNNLAWVLSTSPVDSVRDAERSLEYGEKAAKLTEYSEAHILSTLAAAYAENGNFEEARKWSQKAVDLATEEDHEQLEQLQQELDAYKRDEPWREKQETEENETPLLSPEDLIDT